MNNVKQPLFFKKNRVRRIYTGGKQFGKFFGDDTTEGFYPEEWICSCVQALNDGSTIFKEGISQLETGEYFDEMLNKYPEELLGKGRTELGVLVKMLDSSIRLPVQVHPDKEFSRRYFHSEFGKTESWVIVATEKDACIYFGFSEQISKEDFRKAFDEDEASLVSKMNRIPVKPGDVFLIPGRAVHAIGKGCLLLEVQEPTDFTIQPENKCGEYTLNDREKYLGLSPDVAFDCFDMELAGLEKSLSTAKCLPEKSGNIEKLITYKDTPCFAVNRCYIGSDETVLPAPSIYVAVKGSGKLISSGISREIKQGDYFFAPACLNGKITAVSDGEMELIQCCLPEL